MTTVVVTISSVLRDSADLIDRVGLYRGQGDEPGDATQPQCALTAINRVEGDSHWGAFDYLTRFLGLEMADEVYNWNDRSEEGEVQRVMRAAADKYDEENRP